MVLDKFSHFILWLCVARLSLLSKYFLFSRPQSKTAAKILTSLRYPYLMRLVVFQCPRMLRMKAESEPADHL